MKWGAPFDPEAESIWISASVRGPNALADALVFILDPGTEMSIVDSQVAARIGLDRSKSIGPVQFDGISRTYKAYRVIAGELQAFGRVMSDLEVACSPLQSKFHADGLLGLDFLRHLRVSLDFIEGRISLTDE